MSKSPQQLYNEAMRAWMQAHRQAQTGLGGLGVSIDCRDLAKLQVMLAKMGGLPPKAATSAAGKAATLVKRNIRQGEIPEYTGMLKRGIIRTKKERSKTKGKAVYRIDFDPAFNDVFQKPVKHPGAAGSTSTGNGHAYYPYSMEFGFLTRDGGYYPGFHFMRDGAEESRHKAEMKVLETMVKIMEKDW